MDKKKKTIWLISLAAVLFVLVIGIIFCRTGNPNPESLQEMMRDAVLHETSKVSLFGLMEVNPAVISGFIVTAAVLLFALVIRIFIIPRFRKREVPGKFQMLLEMWVGYFDGLAKKNSPHRNKVLSVYLFAAGSYVFISTLFELFGVQVMNTEGYSVSLPAPLADINAAIALGVTSYLFILAGGIAANGAKGAGKTLKDFSLPISMSFRLFGALLSGALVTELVYYTIYLSFVLPVVVAILFTLLHALIQTYVLTMLVAYFYGEVTEKHEKKPKTKKQKKIQNTNQAAA